jgi:hypothetical protein
MAGRHAVRTAIGCGLAVVLATALGMSPAAAAPLDKGHFHDVFTDQFDCEGTPTQIDGDVSGNFVFVKHGPGLAYYRESISGTQVYTNLDNGGTITEVFTVHSMDLTVTDNGDGTLTIVSLQTGGYRIYDTRGKLVIRDPGQIRSEAVVDDNGTPDDPFDDEFLEDHGIIFGSTGRNDTQGRNFCDDLRLFTS